MLLAAKNAFDEMGVKEAAKRSKVTHEDRVQKIAGKKKTYAEYRRSRRNAGARQGQCGSGAENGGWNRMLKKKKTTASGKLSGQSVRRTRSWLKRNSVFKEAWGRCSQSKQRKITANFLPPSVITQALLAILPIE